MKKIIRNLTPPVAYKIAAKIKKSAKGKNTVVPIIHPVDARPAVVSDNANLGNDGSKQALDIYWDEDFAKVLDTWGSDNAWIEIQFLLINCKGKVLDIACGTGVTMGILSKYQNLDIYGCDISDLLIKKAIGKGLAEEKLSITDATDMEYENDYFDYSYSIGSLEHFTEDGIYKFVKECHRTTKYGSFHQIPISRNGEDVGWITPYQSYFNNSEDWWLEKFKSSYETVYSLRSKWENDDSIGLWFLCFKSPSENTV